MRVDRRRSSVVGMRVRACVGFGLISLVVCVGGCRCKIRGLIPSDRRWEGFAVMSCDVCIRGSCCIVRGRVAARVSAGGIVLRSCGVLVGEGVSSGL